MNNIIFFNPHILFKLYPAFTGRCDASLCQDKFGGLVNAATGEPNLSPGCRQPQEPTKLWTLHMARRRADGRMPKPIAHCDQFSNGPIEFVRFLRQQLPVNLGAPVSSQHAGDFVQ